MALLSALMTEIAIPVCAVIGIAFSLVQCCRLCNSDNRKDEKQAPTDLIDEEQNPTDRIDEEQDPTDCIHEEQDPRDRVHEEQHPTVRMDEEQDPTVRIDKEQDPTDGIDEEHDPTDGIDEEQDPTVRMDEEQDPTDRMDEEQDPTDRIDEEQDPTDRMDEEQDPTDRIDEEQDPTDRIDEEQDPTDRIDGEQDPTDLILFEQGLKRIKNAVSKGVKFFLLKECWYISAFVVAFAILIFLCLGSVERFSTKSRPCKFDPSNTCKPALASAVLSTVSFLLGAFTSVLSGFLGTRIALSSITSIYSKNRIATGRTSFAACMSGEVMGFLLASISVLVLYLAINLFKLYYANDWEGLFEAITGYALGGSSMALFGRACGGIYAKAADVCVHLVEKSQPESLQNAQSPAVITNYVGDIVGDIAGMGPDLFGSYAASSCAALVIASISSFGIKHNFTAMCYPLLISSMGILVSLITTLLGNIKPALKMKQFIISTILMTIGIFVVGLIAVPSSFTIYNIGLPKVVKNWQLFLCVGVGLWAGLTSGFVNKYYTSDDFSCLQHVAVKNFCSRLQDVAAKHFCSYLQAAPQNFSVPLGSVSVPFFAAVSIFVSHHFAATYGISMAALGMLSTIATRLAIDASGLIGNSAKRIGMMASREAHRYVGNNTADITADMGKGFTIELATLVSIALFGAFVSRPAMLSSVNVLTPKVIIGLIAGAWLPYCFSAMTMKSAGRAGFKMALTIHKESVNNAKCFEIATEASFGGMIGPVALVMFTPLVVGTVFGVETLSGLLAGSLGSVVQIAISASKTDGAWNQAKEDIRAGALEYAEIHFPDADCRLSELAKKGETIGDEWKDTSGPPLKILVQLMAVESLVFAPFFDSHGGLLFKFL